MCFVWIWEQTAIIFLYSFNWLVFITEMECVYCAVRTGSLYMIHFILTFWRVSYNFTSIQSVVYKAVLKRKPNSWQSEQQPPSLSYMSWSAIRNDLWALRGLQQVPREAVKVVILTQGSRTVASPHGDTKNTCESLGGHGVNSKIMLFWDVTPRSLVNRCYHCEQNWYLSLRSLPVRN